MFLAASWVGWTESLQPEMFNVKDRSRNRWLGRWGEIFHFFPFRKVVAFD